MIKSYINTYNGLKKSINKVSDLVNLLRDKNKKFIIDFEFWLTSTEEFLKKNNFSECSEMAGLRSRLYLVNFEDIKASNKKKKQMEIGAEMIYSAQNLVYNLIQPIEDKINEAKELTEELVTIAYKNNIININPNEEYTNYIQSLWNHFKSHEQLSKYALKITSLIGNTDALRFFAEEVSKR